MTHIEVPNPGPQQELMKLKCLLRRMSGEAGRTLNYMNLKKADIVNIIRLAKLSLARMGELQIPKQAIDDPPELEVRGYGGSME